MAKVSPTDWFKIQGWMATEFDLTMGELVAFALVHTFTRPKEGKVYTGGVPYLAKFAHIHPDTARKYLHSLEGKGLIVAVNGDTNGVPFTHYYTPENFKGIPSKNARVLPRGFQGGTPENFGGKQKDKQKGKHLPKEEKKSTKKESFTDSIVRQWQNKQ